MNATEIEKALEKYATSDLRLAKRHGMIMVAQTKQGNVEITHADGVYTLTKQGTARYMGADAKVLAQGKPAVVRPVLAALYDVVVES